MLTYESQMLPILSANKAKLGAFDFEASELASGYGIADLVFYNLKPNARRKRPITSLDALRLLTELKKFEDDTVSVTTLRNKLTFSSNKNEVITYLLQEGYLDEVNEEQYKRAYDYTVGFSEVIAIEAKLKDWKRGLYQAYRYRDFANESYLALYSPYLHRALKNLDEFKKYNVGLIEVTESNLNIVFRPQREESKQNLFSATAYENALQNLIEAPLATTQ